MKKINQENLSNDKQQRLFISDEDLDVIVASLRQVGFRYGIVLGQRNCKVSLYNKQEGLQLAFMNDCLHFLDLKEKRKFKIMWGSEGFRFEGEQLIIDPDLGGIEIQL